MIHFTLRNSCRKISKHINKYFLVNGSTQKIKEQTVSTVQIHHSLCFQRYRIPNKYHME